MINFIVSLLHEPITSHYALKIAVIFLEETLNNKETLRYNHFALIHEITSINNQI